MQSYHTLLLGLNRLVIFRRLLEDAPIRALRRLLETDPADELETTSAYCAFAAALFAEDTDFSRYLLSFLLEDENLYIRGLLSGKTEPALAGLLDRELAFMKRLAAFDGSEYRAALPDGQTLPKWENSALDFPALYADRIRQIPTKGFGIFAKHSVFTLGEDGRLLPVRHPDPIRLEDLYAYETERGKVIANTKTLLEGKNAGNVLLYGDAGTGKSSTVKAIVNQYKEKGLRLIEISKKQIYCLPELMDSLAGNPLKFILFIDDLCFESDDREFSAFKAILEGGVNARGRNVVIYATSNHRHLVKERVRDRMEEEINLGDTLQELSSLSARFGLTVTFERPNKARYGEIVRRLAAQYALDLPEEALLLKAEAFAMRAGGRNARVAKQFVELQKAGVLS